MLIIGNVGKLFIEKQQRIYQCRERLGWVTFGERQGEGASLEFEFASVIFLFTALLVHLYLSNFIDIFNWL